jgi:hypothetical protein
MPHRAAPNKFEHMFMLHVAPLLQAGLEISFSGFPSFGNLPGVG